VLIFGINATVSAQLPYSSKAKKYHKAGLKAFNKKNFVKADSMFSLSASIEDNKSNYTYLAMTKLALGDSCGYCKALYDAIIGNDKKSIELYGSKCTDTTTIMYDCIKSDTIYFCKAVKNVCEVDYEYFFYKKNLISNKTVSFNINETNYTKNELFDSKFRMDEVPLECVFSTCEIMPEFPGGEYEMMKFICQTLRYPQSCKENNISGKIFVNFVVNEQGKVIKVKVVKGAHPLLDKEAKRVVLMLPDFKPGMQDGKPVKVQFTIPINFQLFTIAY
jgi:TonB family protein